ncbi:MAG: flippase-like domain-containing protein [Bacilli bacterium]|jgi:uncharacterized protein (TIRG00374 family)|nr:flippase-like domain-containing protein [Bacilli bacterium]
MKRIKRYFLSIGLFFILFGITFYYIFSKYSLTEFYLSFQKCNHFFILGAFFCVLLYLLLGAIFTKKMFQAFQTSITWFQSLSYNCIEIYFSAVTPSSTGGQPVEAYYMGRDKIPYQKSTVVILLNTILYKLAIVILGLIGMIFVPKLIFQNGWFFTFLMLLGLFINIVVIVFFTCLIYSKTLPQKMLKIGMNLLSFLHLLKGEEKKKKEENMNTIMKDYQNCAEFTQNHPKIILKSFGYILLQRICLFGVSYFIYRAFGLNDYNFFAILFLQIAITQATDCVPFPGGVMAGETLTYQITSILYGTELAFSSMLLLRGISFYFLVFLSSLFFVIYHFKSSRKRKEL